jgi:hypothetical protein
MICRWSGIEDFALDAVSRYIAERARETVPFDAEEQRAPTAELSNLPIGLAITAVRHH